MPTISAPHARRVLMHAQGLFEPLDQSVTTGTLGELIGRLGYVQVDSINVIERAHHLTLFSRLPAYRKPQLAELRAKRDIFEHWTHDASVIPVAFYPYWRHHFERWKRRLHEHNGFQRRLGDKPRRTLRHVRERLDAEGPMMSKDFKQPPRDGETGGWWNWKPHKAALEYLWWTGEASVVKRINFHKVYDLAHRAYPDHHDAPRPHKNEFLDFSCSAALERLVIATPKEIAAFWGGLISRDVTPWCNAREREGAIERVIVASEDGSAPHNAYAVADWHERIEAAESAFARVERAVRLLSPFDPVIRDRDRLKRRFDFDYRFEAFTPAAKRTYGYYVLPILEGDRLIGRADLKHHRDRKAVAVQGMWFEPGVKETKARRRAIDDALERLAAFIGAETVEG